MNGRIVTAVLCFSSFFLWGTLLPAADFTHLYEVGPGKSYPTPADVPWESLQSSTLVLIYYRAQPYRDKWVIATAGTAESPVVVRGVVDGNGNRPVISGDGAVTRLQLDYWNESRSVIKIGGSSHPSEFPSYITIENLDIRSARPSFSFTDDGGSSGTYSNNAAAIHVEEGSHITIRNCILSDSANGFFAGSAASEILFEENDVHGNGMEGSIYQHNNYTEVDHITFQYNYFGPLRPGCLGNNLKDRSAGTLIRYNWIESGSRTIDLVDSDHEALLTDPDYRETRVYGNVLVKHDVVENGQVLHYGGDSGDFSRYRKGRLYFYNNTVVSHRSDKTTLLGISTNDENVTAVNNIFFLSKESGSLAVMGSEGVVDLSFNWLPEGWQITHESGLNGSLTATDNLVGLLPGFVDGNGADYHLAAGSVCIDAAESQTAPDSDLDKVKRPQGGGYDMGGYEFTSTSMSGILLLLLGIVN